MRCNMFSVTPRSTTSPPGASSPRPCSSRSEKTPIGPVLVTADEIADHANLRLTTKVNGETMQDANTGEMIFNLAKIIAYITDTVTLKAGDVIATGTPGGVGMSFKPPRLLKPGDEVVVEVESIGKIRTPIVARADLRPASSAHNRYPKHSAPGRPDQVRPGQARRRV